MIWFCALLFPILYFSFISKCCPFESYSDALIPDGVNLYTEKYQVKIKKELGDSFGFGFWMLPTAFAEYNRTFQDLFQVKNENNEIYFYGRLNDNFFPYMTLSFFIPTSTLGINYQFYEFQNKWIFILFVVIPSQKRLIIQTTSKNFQWYYFSKVIDQQVLFFSIGNFDQQFINLFSGKLSKFSYFTNFYYDATIFQQFSEQCAIPNPVNEPQNTQIIQGLNIFNNDKTISISFDQYGNRYTISGWVKYNYDFVSYQILYQLIRISVHQSKQQQKVFGDELFKLEAGFSNSNLQINKIKITIDSYCIYSPPYCKVSLINGRDKYNEFIYNDLTSNIYQEGLLQWHFFQYEYGRKNYQQELMLFQLQFFNQIGHISQKIGNVQRFSFADCKFYIFVGEANLNYSLLSASIYDLKFQFYYDNDQDFLITCHPTCKDCNGPLKTNCLSCFENQFRYFQTELKSCECRKQYYQFEEDIDCKLYEESFPQIIQSEIDIPLTCQLGQFYYPYLNEMPKCLQCPQNEQNKFNCIDCIYNSTTWYLEPICKHDLKQRGKSPDEVFNFTIRSSFDIDLYIIDELFSLQLMIGCESFCENKKGTNCNKLNKTYLGQEVYIICKNGFVFQQNACIQQEQYSTLLTISNTDINCSAGSYLLGNFCYNCPNYCTICAYSLNKQRVICQSCQEAFTIQNDICVKCGTNCKYCQLTSDSTSKISYLQCLKCIDDSVYFLSASQTNCLKNEIQGCQYVLQKYKANFLQSNSYPSTQKFITICAYCNPLQIYSFEKNKCILDTQIYTEQNICLKGYQSPSGYFCYSSAQSLYSYSFYLNCSSYIAFCNLCQKQLNLQTQICIQCIPGFYANRLTGFCQLCPQELENCEQCGQQQILQQDYWIFAVRPFIRQFMELSTFFDFLTMGQSQNISSYEVICLKCKAGYALHQNKCIQMCFEGCQVCVLNNDKYECVKCGLTARGRMLTLLNNQCIECPEYCSVCRLRSDSEIASINKLFNNQNFTKYTRQCLKSYDDDLYSYDSLLGQFVKCSSQNQFCENEIQITLNLYCDLQKYQQDLNNCQNDKERQQFYQQNILYEDLFSNKSFYHFENYYFYLKANTKIIKSIVIKISSSGPQYCNVESEAIITQRFGENIFSVLNVSLLLNFTESTIFNLEGSLKLQNFNSIYIKGVHFISNTICQSNIINFVSVYPQDVKLLSINFEASSYISFQQQIIFDNLQNLEIGQTNILNLNLIESIGFIKILQSIFDKSIIIKDFTVRNSSFSNMSVFEFNLGYNDQVLISNCNINGHFQNSSFIVVKSSLQQSIQQYNGIMEIAGVTFFDIQVKETNYLIDIEKLRYFSLSDLTLSLSQFFSSTLLNSCIKYQLRQFNIYNLKLLQGSNLIINSNFLKGNVEIIFQDISFRNVELDEISHFIKLQKFFTSFQSLRITRISLSQNFCKVVTQILPQIERSQIYLNLQKIYLEELFISKNYGITELSIFNSENIVINSSYIYQESQFGSFGLHKNLICLTKKLQQKSYLETIIIFSSINIKIENITVTGTSTYNSPFLLIKSAELELASQQEYINLKDFKAKNNIFIQSDGQKQLSLFQIKSSQQVHIRLTNSIFENNILHQYQQNNLKTSATLINIDCELCTFYLSQSNWVNNTVINGTDSIMFVNAKEIILEKNTFISNSIFHYELIQPYLFWEFENEIEIYLENIEETFPVKSLSGNGWFLAQNLYFYENVVQQSMGMEGGAFKIEGKNNSIININSLKLEEISTLFQSKEEYGGALYIDGYNAQQIQILLINIEASEIFCQHLGGLIYIHVENIHSEINISNINFVDVIAYSGSFLYCEFFFKADHNQILYISQVQGKNTYLGLEKFLNKFNTIETNDILNLASNKSLIYIDSGTEVKITEFLLQNSYYESLLIYNNALKISFFKISVLQSSISNYLIQINFIETQSSFLTLGYSVFLNLEFSQPQVTECNLTQLETPQRQFFCSNNFSVAPKLINRYSLEKNSSSKQFGCLLNNINQNSLGLILLNGLTNLTSIIVKNLKLHHILCFGCSKGAINFNFYNEPQKSYSIILNQLYIINSICGLASCINIKATSSDQSRILQNNYAQIFFTQLQIQFYQCQQNVAFQGTCLFINNINAQVENSLFQHNNATKNGGAIIVQGKKQFLISKSVIENNKGQIGGGIFLKDQFAIQYNLLANIFINNQAYYYGDNFACVPQKLSVIMNESGIPMEIITKVKNKFNQIDEVRANNLNNSYYIYLPSGQSISGYSKYIPSNRSYKFLNLSLAIIALQLDNTIAKNLDNSSCQIFSRQYNLSQNEENQNFTNNFTNLNYIMFEQETQSYNLNNLVLYFGQTDIDLVLQLDLFCNSIQVPNYNPKFPYNVIGSHNNYKLRLNIKTFSCQLGEIQNSTFKFCSQCDSNLGFFSLKLNQEKCQLKDEITTSDVKPAELKLRAGFWRPYFDTDILSQCINLLINCNGGWIEGDSSCLEGHVGALCEQCDIENVRGFGRYSENDKFYCSQCSSNYSNIFIIVIITTWTLISLYIAVNGNVKIQLEFTKLSPFTRYRLARNLNKTQSGALLKILTNYFQIIASITTFRLSFTKIFIDTTNTLGTPVLTMVLSQDCFLSDLFNLEIHYSRVIWLLFLQLAYILLFSILFYLGTLCQLIKSFKIVFITSLLYVYIYFQPDIVGSLISLLSYRQISGYQWIQANLAYRYDTSKHLTWIIKFCLPLMLVFSLMIPLALFLNLFQCRHQLENRRVRMKYGYLYHEYKNNAYFWEIVKINEKQLIIFFLRFYEDQIVLKGIFILCISYIYQQLNSYYRPYYLNNLNQLDYYSANICMISFAFSIGAYVSQQITENAIEIIFLIFVTFLNFLFAVYLLSKIVNEYIKTFDWSFEKVLVSLRTQWPFLMNFRFVRKRIARHSLRKKRLTYLLGKFKSRALALAKGSIFAKRIISQTWRPSLDSNGQLDSNNNLQENISLKGRRSLMFCSLDNSFQLKNKESEGK